MEPKQIARHAHQMLCAGSGRVTYAEEGDADSACLPEGAGRTLDCLDRSIQGHVSVRDLEEALIRSQHNGDGFFEKVAKAVKRDQAATDAMRGHIPGSSVRLWGVRLRGRGWNTLNRPAYSKRCEIRTEHRKLWEQYAQKLPKPQPYSAPNRMKDA